MVKINAIIIILKSQLFLLLSANYALKQLSQRFTIKQISHQISYLLKMVKKTSAFLICYDDYIVPKNTV